MSERLLFTLNYKPWIETPIQMTDQDDADKEIDRFKLDVARFSAHYEDFLVIVKTPGKRMLWKASDNSWSLGSAIRFVNWAESQDNGEDITNE